MYPSDSVAVTPSSKVERSPSVEPLATRSNALPAVGNTPLISLKSLVARTGGRFELWGKAEWFNPTGSVKDRAASEIVRVGLEQGLLGSGRSLLDASSGNTAVAYAALGKRLGFGVTLCVPRNASAERLERIRRYGAKIVLTDPLEGTDGAQVMARRMAEDHPSGYYYADQYNNPANPEAHYRGTGPEIWQQSAGKVTHLVVGVGTGGTLSGTARYLLTRRASLRVIGVQPNGPLHGLEGLKHLPTARRPSTYDEALVNATVTVDTEAAKSVVGELEAFEGIRVGPSAGAAVWASLQVGLAHPESYVVTILPDGDSQGRRRPNGEDRP